jgi:predicted DNA-binding transcriptional regulator AlpA
VKTKSKSPRSTKSIPPPKSTTQFAPPIEPDVSAADCIRSPARLIDKAEVLRRVPVSFPTLWAWMRDGNFPRSKNIGGKVAWIEAEVEAWINARPDVQIKVDEQARSP